MHMHTRIHATQTFMLHAIISVQTRIFRWRRLSVCLPVCSRIKCRQDTSRAWWLCSVSASLRAHAALETKSPSQVCQIYAYTICWAIFHVCVYTYIHTYTHIQIYCMYIYTLTPCRTLILTKDGACRRFSPHPIHRLQSDPRRPHSRHLPREIDTPPAHTQTCLACAHSYSWSKPAPTFMPVLQVYSVHWIICLHAWIKRCSGSIDICA